MYICLSKKQVNRIRNGYFCYKKKCPKDKPILGFDRKCYSCNDKKEKINAIEGGSACSQRYESGFWSEKVHIVIYVNIKIQVSFFLKKSIKNMKI